ncbi:hypothetical protein GOODEAATRI_009546 [Goodea atripinnis]|uniref:Uncharacterized protein n=1 Tax=Goodea atripinnis TaxID=208336 RepID=A0ABV0P2S3_9TELE
MVYTPMTSDLLSPPLPALSHHSHGPKTLSPDMPPSTPINRVCVLMSSLSHWLWVTSLCPDLSQPARHSAGSLLTDSERKGFMNKLYAIQDVCISVQNALDEVASYGERIKK